MNLSNKKAKNLTFSGIDGTPYNSIDNIDHATFTKCIFASCTFSELDFTNTKFINCKFVGCLFDDCVFDTTDFSSATITDTCMFDECTFLSLRVNWTSRALVSSIIESHIHKSTPDFYGKCELLKYCREENVCYKELVETDRYSASVKQWFFEVMLPYVLIIDELPLEVRIPFHNVKHDLAWDATS